jgi:hypothetical protein
VRCTLHDADGCPCAADATSIVIYPDAGIPNEADACDRHATLAVIDAYNHDRDVTVTRRGRR